MPQASRILNTDGLASDRPPQCEDLPLRLPRTAVLALIT